MPKKIEFIACDFETTNDKVNPQVYSWGWMNENETFKYGISIESFIFEIEKIKKDIWMFFHNGSKFDFHFIIPELDRLGYIQKIKLLPMHKYAPAYYLKLGYSKFTVEKSTEFFELSQKYFSGENFEKYYLQKLEQKNKFLLEREYEIIANGSFKIMEIKICIPNKKRAGKKSRNRVVILRDSNLLFTGSIKSYGNTLNENSGTTFYSKMEDSIAYDKKTLYNSLNELENDNNELSYLKQDCYILLSYLKLMDSSFPRKNWNMTAAATAYNVWRFRFFGVTILEEQIKKGNIIELQKSSGMHNYMIKGEKKIYTSKRIKIHLLNQIFPLKAIDKDLYEWYAGGLTGANPEYRGVMIKDIGVYDFNSHYPNQMRNKMLPFGPVERGDKKGNEMKYYTITAKSDLFNNTGIPFIGVTNKSKRSPYSHMIPKGYIFKLTSIELPYFKKYYKGEYIIFCNFSQKMINRKDIFKDYIDYYYNLKSTTKDKGEKAIAKLFLNALYGKFGTKIDRTSRIWNSEAQQWEIEQVTTDFKFYLPLAIAITAYGRMGIVETVADNYKYVLGNDTDSLFLRNDKINHFDMQISATKLGHWKNEYPNSTVSGFMRRSKQYIFKVTDNETLKETWKIAFAGINFNKPGLEKFKDFTRFITGVSIPKQIRPIRLPSGVLLEETEKMILPIWDKEYIKNDFGLKLWYDSEQSYKDNYDKQLLKLYNY